MKKTAEQIGERVARMQSPPVAGQFDIKTTEGRKAWNKAVQAWKDLNKFTPALAPANSHFYGASRYSQCEGY